MRKPGEHVSYEPIKVCRRKRCRRRFMVRSWRDRGLEFCSRRCRWLYGSRMPEKVQVLR